MKVNLLKLSTALCACSLLAVGCADRDMGGSAEQSASTKGSASSRASSADAQFIRDAASAGLAEVQMGQLLQQKGQSESVKQFGQHLVRDHTQANQELTSLATQKGLPVSSQMKMEDQQSVTRLTAASGEQFDQVAKQEAITAHQKVIQQFQTAQSKVQDPELKAYIQKTLPVLQQHLEHAQSLPASGQSTSGAQGGSESDASSSTSSGSSSSDSTHSHDAGSTGGSESDQLDQQTPDQSSDSDLY